MKEVSIVRLMNLLETAYVELLESKNGATDMNEEELSDFLKAIDALERCLAFLPEVADRITEQEEAMNKEKEIMHCKDCMWYDTESEWSIRGKYMCIFHDIYCSQDDFCSWAERDEEGKEEEND